VLLEYSRLVGLEYVDKVFNTYTLKKGWVVLTQFWVKYGQTQPLGYTFK